MVEEIEEDDHASSQEKWTNIEAEHFQTETSL